MSRTMGVEGVTTLTMAPVLDVRETDLMGTLKLIKDTPEGGASETVTVKLAVPEVGGTVPPESPLQEFNEKTARTSKIVSPRENRFM
jgi:hypothetical protein